MPGPSAGLLRGLDQSDARPMPRGPVFGWDSFRSISGFDLASVEQLPHQAYTTSGRSAIYQALCQLKLAPDSTVLLPTYHCPTMVAPVLLAGARPSYFAILPNGLPDLDRIPAEIARQASAMLVPHYFGLPQSLARVRAWCDEHRIMLIEDCAHSLFGEAGERSVGAWGDFATASLSKFLPVPEGGLLASSTRPLLPLQLVPQGLKAELKGFVDVIEVATLNHSLKGLNGAVGSLFWLKRAWRSPVAAQAAAPAASSERDFMVGSDMQRIDRAPLVVSRWLMRGLPRSRIIARRRENYDRYAHELRDCGGARALFQIDSARTAPYVFPLWVDDAERVYQSLRTRGYPVFRWDRIWPDTPKSPGDTGPLWSRHVLQLLCHQDLSCDDIGATAAAINRLLG